MIRSRLGGRTFLPPGRASCGIALAMISIQVKSDRDPRVLADLIAQTQRDESAPQAAPEAELVREFIAQQDADRPSHDELDTVNFQRLDDDNDWTDV